ncbi:hypothetical protein [Roseibium aggregatum]|jgi:hypothetical protein|uniref:hypothetical protein n=1 Tax=Roseibium aggregatum TaxID=187304 RepID=UPI001E64A978|nr:hypothetical protein [Roseibium aggregatum]UES46678.1 hypothetical protein GFK90_24475 [Roseibium aggregatum]
MVIGLLVLLLLYSPALMTLWVAIVGRRKWTVRKEVLVSKVIIAVSTVLCLVVWMSYFLEDFDIARAAYITVAYNLTAACIVSLVIYIAGPRSRQRAANTKET